MGLVPWCTKIGDGVSVVLGSSVLFVMRQVGLGVEREEEQGKEEGKKGTTKKEKNSQIEKKDAKDPTAVSDEDKKPKISTEETWTLIGDAYVHGLMDGEPLAEDGFSTRELRIC